MFYNKISWILTLKTKLEDWVFCAVYTIHQNCLDKSLNTTAELVIPIGISTKEAQAELETHPENAEAKINRC